MQGEEDILQRFDHAALARKTWRGAGDWRAQPSPGGPTRLTRVLSLDVAGVAPNGLQARFVCREDLPEQDVYAHLEMHIPEVPCFGHFQRVSWRPLRSHTNGAKVLGLHRLKTIRDRQETFPANRHLGIRGLRQTVTTVAEPLHPVPGSFRDLLSYLQDFWRIDALHRVADPPWQNRLI